MAKGVTIKHVRKAGPFTNGELAAGEKGLDVTAGVWYWSRNGTTVETSGSAGDMAESEYATNGAPGKVDTAINAEKLGNVVAANYALKTYADTAASNAVAAAIDAAPGALDTLNELAAALGDDPNFAATMTTALAGKAPSSHTHAASDITGDLAAARMQVNLAAALQAIANTLNSANLTIDGGTL